MYDLFIGYTLIQVKYLKNFRYSFSLYQYQSTNWCKQKLVAGF